jgi:hypothetical protein
MGEFYEKSVVNTHGTGALSSTFRMALAISLPITGFMTNPSMPLACIFLDRSGSLIRYTK